MPERYSELVELANNLDEEQKRATRKGLIAANVYAHGWQQAVSEGFGVGL